MDEEYEKAINILTGALKVEAAPKTCRNSVDATSGATSQAPERKDTVPVGISNRHIHLSQADLEALFGPGYQLTKLKDLSQPGQFASKETVMLAGPKGAITKVRILGPVRAHTQIEILASDQFKLGTKAPVRLSGHLDGTPGVTVVGPKTSIKTPDGLIIAQRHIHMLPQQAIEYGVHDGETVALEIEGLRGGVLNNVIIRAKANSGLECHIDTEEANALGVTSGMPVKIKKIGGNE